MTEEIPKKIVQPLDIKDEARPHSLTGGDIDWPNLPPAAESIAACVEKGFVIVNPDGSVTGVSQKFKVAWGAYELIELVEALWPDIPKAGVPWNEIVARARRANILLAIHGETSDQFIYQQLPQ